VRKIFEEEKETWSEDARKIMGGIVRMRDSGLRRLRKKLDPIDSVAKQTIDDWDAEAASLNETIRAFEEHAKKGAGAFAWKGQMMDQPHLTRAKKIADRARRAGVI